MEKETQKNWNKIIKEWGLTALGTLLLGAALKFFLEPNHIAGGGATGMAIILSSILGMKFSTLTTIINIILLIIGLIFIGKGFGAKTILSMVVLSAGLYVMDFLFPSGKAVTNNLFLATVFGTLLAGTGIGLVFNQNASTGGTDIIAKIINKYTYFDIGKALLGVDFLVTLGAAQAFGIEIGMYFISCYYNWSYD